MGAWEAMAGRSVSATADRPPVESVATESTLAAKSSDRARHRTAVIQVNISAVLSVAAASRMCWFAAAFAIKAFRNPYVDGR